MELETRIKVDNRITCLFAVKQQRVLAVFYTAGFPTLDSTIEIARHLEKAGADIIEIGIPFSDPIADGVVIQGSSSLALKNGMTIKKLLQQIIEIRKNVQIPILLMGYLNPVLQYGIEKFCQDASKAGVDGVILPDLPLREYLEQYAKSFASHGLSNVFLISPTTSVDRIRQIDDNTTGFLYAVSSAATTGAKEGFTSDLDVYLDRLHSLKLKNLWLVGFGISSNETFSRVCKYAAGGIIGSSFVSMIGKSSNLERDIAEFVRSIRG